MSASLTCALVQDFQRLQKFVEEFFLALAEIGLRRQHADGVALVAGAAVIGFAAEDGEHNGRRHAELLFDCPERVAILIEQLAASSGETVERRLFQIVRRRQHEFRLPARRPLRPARQNKLGQRQIGLKPARRQIEGRARHAERLRLRPQRLQPGLERRVRECGVQDAKSKKIAAVKMERHRSDANSLSPSRGEGWGEGRCRSRGPSPLAPALSSTGRREKSSHAPLR